MTAQNTAENQGGGEGNNTAPKAPRAPTAKDMGELRDGLKMAQMAIKSLSKEDKKIARSLLSELGVGRGSEASEEEDESDEGKPSERNVVKLSQILNKVVAREKLTKKEREIVDDFQYDEGYHTAGPGFWGFMGELTGFSDVKRAFKAKGFNNRAGGAMAAGAKGFGLGFGGYQGYKLIRGWLSNS
jgi:hypothetical protein